MRRVAARRTKYRVRSAKCSVRRTGSESGNQARLHAVRHFEKRTVINFRDRATTGHSTPLSEAVVYRQMAACQPLTRSRFDPRHAPGDDSAILFQWTAILDVNTGIVTLLFTDIEGSTEKWEQEPEQMAHALARHDALLRAAVEAHRGRVIKTTGCTSCVKTDDLSNQVELWFANIERDVIARGVFTSVPDLKRKLMRYIRTYNQDAKPVKWKYFDSTRRITPASIVTVH
jgi:hypothetical protein